MEDVTEDHTWKVEDPHSFLHILTALHMIIVSSIHRYALMLHCQTTSSIVSVEVKETNKFSKITTDWHIANPLNREASQNVAAGR